jgi:hypothetical protein
MRRTSPPIAALLLTLLSSTGGPALGAPADAAPGATTAPADADSAAPRVPRAPVLDASRYVQVEVADPYLELHTGPGRGYPVFHVVPRGERVDVLFSRTDWYKIRDDRGREGWANRSQLLQTLLPGGEAPRLRDPKRRDYDEDPWEAGAQSGNFGGGNVNGAFLAYSLTDRLAIEAGASQLLGRASNAVMATLGATHSFRPEWRLSPFVQIGTGFVRISPKATIVAPDDRTEQVAYVGAGLRYSLSRRFVFRGDYRSYVIFTERENNEERQEWKVGFAFYF